MASVVLITGVTRFLGAQLAAELVSDPSIERVIGVDHAPPRKADQARLGRTEFVRADIRNPLIAKVLTQARVDTVVHAPLTGRPRGVSGRLPNAEHNVLGTMQLLAACQKSDSVRRLVLESTTAVYGSGAADPAVFTEDMHSAGCPLTGYAKDAVEIEGYVRGFGRRRADIAVSVLRFAPMIGPTVDSPLAHYLAMPIVPTSLGYDPRLQLLHESDAVEVLRLAASGRDAGVVNVAADGVIALSQAVRRAGRVRLPVPAAAISAVGALVRNSGVLEFSAEQAAFLNYGRVVDTARLREQFGYQPRYTTEAALDSYLEESARLPRLGASVLEAVQRMVTPTPPQLTTGTGA
ncbi:MAG TPA: NAD-dependent epimerase/dehydratase family protein [Jatrophihabitantaceae bacterium]|nr:NAD-dependent epimerase/dehydratase family protein [Jatrophihabitantaceae bacterium]